jgi:alanine dehydrogenase
MRIGVPKEVKNREFRVGLTPDGVKELVGRGHQVSIERQAGAAIGFSDGDYTTAGAVVLETADAVFGAADLIVKVKEPQPAEIARLRPHHVLFTYLHLAPDPVQAKALMASGACCIAYETVTDDRGGLPLLAPMSEVAGRLSVQVGARYLEIPGGGAGVLLGGVTGVQAARVVVIGAGAAGLNAAQMALGLGARVTVFDRAVDRLRHVNDVYGGRMEALYSTRSAVSFAAAGADLVIGAVLIPGSAAPRILSRADISRMRPGSVIVDIAIDQGGCFETSRPTTHDEPVYVEEGVTHYCVTNMPAAVARTSTLALTSATLPFVVSLADLGAEAAMAANRHLAAGLNVADGRLRHPEVEAALRGRV